MEDISAETYVSLIELITAILLFLAAAFSIAKGLWSAFSRAEEKPQVLVSVFTWMSAFFFFVSCLIGWIKGQGIFSLSILGLGWVLQVIAYFLDDEHQKARTFLVIIGAVGIAFLIQLQVILYVIGLLVERTQ